MTQQQKFEVFKAQTENVRYLERVWKNLNRSINQAYLKDDKSSIEIHTKLLILTYSAYAEAIFSKVLHTPHGLSVNEIGHIKKVAHDKGISNGWKQCLSLAIKKMEGTVGSHKPNVTKKMHELIDTYVFDPSLLRNKIAHGQWLKALNRENTSVNQKMTSQLQSLNIIILYRYKEALKSLAQILEDIIESPNKAHRINYWVHITEFEESQIKMSKWTIQNKVDELKMKRSYYSPENT